MTVPSSPERKTFKRVIVVTGTPGVGKTIVSEKLARKLKALHLDLGDIVTREKITSGYDSERQTLIADSEKVRKRLQELMKRRKKDVIVDGHYATEVVPKEQLTKAFVLRCHPQELMQRIQKRGYEGKKLKENLAAEILDVCLADAVKDVGIEKVCEIDTTNKTVDDVVNAILLILKRKMRCMVGIVDWLATLEIENTLDEYLKEL